MLELKSYFEQQEQVKNDLLNEARQLVKNSKKIIYAIFRDDHQSLDELLETNRGLLEAVNSKLELYPELRHSISFGLQEYAEAEILYSYFRFRRLPTHEELSIDPVSYLMGLMDFCGEALRYVIRKLVGADPRAAIEELNALIELFQSLHLDMLEIGPQAYELRKKLDYLVGLINKALDIAFKVKFSSTFEEKKEVEREAEGK